MSAVRPANVQALVVEYVLRIFDPFGSGLDVPWVASRATHGLREQIVIKYPRQGAGERRLRRFEPLALQNHAYRRELLCWWEPVLNRIDRRNPPEGRLPGRAGCRFGGTLAANLFRCGLYLRDAGRDASAIGGKNGLR